MKELRITTKSLRRGAFAVGFGLYFGKEVAKMIDRVVCKTVYDLMKTSAKNGNEFMQDTEVNSSGNQNVDFDKRV